MQRRKQELLDGVIEYLVRHGPADVSLRPMAAELGTSARLLIFHFGSKERLLAEALDEMHDRLQRSLIALGTAKPGSPRTPLLKAFWNWAIAEENFGHLRLHYQLQVLTTQSTGNSTRPLKRHSENWLKVIQAALPAPRRSPGFATLLGAVFDGLFLELMSTGDRRRTTQALDQFIQLAQPTQARTRRRPEHPATSPRTL
jgi:AcrR family transcriptional regulator